MQSGELRRLLLCDWSAVKEQKDAFIQVKKVQWVHGSMEAKFFKEKTFLRRFSAGKYPQRHQKGQAEIQYRQNHRQRLCSFTCCYRTQVGAAYLSKWVGGGRLHVSWVIFQLRLIDFSCFFRVV
mmetsp:Transcript_30202/g.43152  ORF Transcript_30202/g.43152 Transcript_30202/m.43152 type:complete len:124 (+) Transcript_30202:1236-1607(+)